MGDTIPINWGILDQTPNFGQSALSGYQAGRAIGKERAVQQAMAGLDLTKPETLGPILRADPSTGAALLSASIELHKATTDAATKQVLSDYLLARDKGSGAAALTGGAGTQVSPSPAPPVPSFLTNPTNPAATIQATGAVAPMPPAPGTAPSAPAPSALAAARAALMRIDPEKFIELETKIGAMSKADREMADDATSTMAAVGQGAMQLPYEQRRAYIMQHSDMLTAHGFTAQQIAQFDPTDQNIAAETNQSLGVKGILEQQDKDRNFGLSQSRFGEEVHHNRVDEGQGAARIGIAGGQLAVSRGHLAIDQAAAAKKTGLVGGGIATPTNAAEYNALPSGSRYYKNGVIKVKS